MLTTKPNLFPTEILLNSTTIIHSPLSHTKYLSCIHNNNPYVYQICQRKAVEGDIVYIVALLPSSPFSDIKYIGRCFKVTTSNPWQHPDDNYVEVQLLDGEYNYERDFYWRLYDKQYVVLCE